jgi:hypothetical protein
MIVLSLPALSPPRTPFPRSLPLRRLRQMKARMRLLPVLVLMQGMAKGTAAAGGNSSAFDIQSPTLNTSPFWRYDDRPDGCPPWYALVDSEFRLIGL